jgi:holo-ACP synthase
MQTKKNDHEYKAEDILLARESRVTLQVEILKKYRASLLVHRVNYPGLYRNNNITEGISTIIEMEICKVLSSKIISEYRRNTAEGPICIFSLKEDKYKIKSVTMEIEEKHELGRFVDLDVYDENGVGISRLQMDKSKRKCYLCENDAVYCIRNGNHSQDEIIEYIKNRYAYIAKAL